MNLASKSWSKIDANFGNLLFFFEKTWILGNLSKQKQRTMLANSDRDPMEELRRRPGCAASDTGSNSRRTVKKKEKSAEFAVYISWLHTNCWIYVYPIIQNCRRETCLCWFPDKWKGWSNDPWTFAVSQVDIQRITTSLECGSAAMWSQKEWPQNIIQRILTQGISKWKKRTFT